jgi:hypothetical protein
MTKRITVLRQESGRTFLVKSKDHCSTQLFRAYSCEYWGMALNSLNPGEETWSQVPYWYTGRNCPP